MGTPHTTVAQATMHALRHLEGLCYTTKVLAQAHDLKIAAATASTALGRPLASCPALQNIPHLLEQGLQLRHVLAVTLSSH